MDYSQLAPHERNTLRLMFLYPPYAVDPQLGRNDLRLLAGFRAAMAQAPDKAPFLALVEDPPRTAKNSASGGRSTTCGGSMKVRRS